MDAAAAGIRTAPGERGAAIVTDASSTPSPPPARSIFQLRPGRGDAGST
jgi:hypothetical protein